MKDEQKIEKELRSFFINEVKEVEPSASWWDRAVSNATNADRVFSFWDHIAEVFSKPVLRAALPIAMVLIVIGTLLGTGIIPGLQGGKDIGPAPISTVPSVITVPPTTTAPPKPLLTVTATTDKSSYFPGENVEITFSLNNITQEPLTLSHFSYAEITRLGIMIRSFDSGIQEIKLAPGGSGTFKLAWNQVDNEGRQVKPAVYQLAVEYITITKGSPPVTTQYSFHEVGQVNIVFPQGVMEKVIEVNRSQTADGITLTLQRVELLADRMKIYVLKTPGYTPSQPGKPEPPSLAGKADITGTYSVDDGDALGLGSFGYRPVDDRGVEYIWESLYPVPADAHTLSVRITRFTTLTGSAVSDNDGPWEFEIQLQ
jgi:hypothetical protein